MTARCNLERTPEGVRVCWGNHDKALGCEWEYFASAGARPAPGEREQALLDAARAMCWMCRDGMPFREAPPDGSPWHERTDARPGLTTKCQAGPIRALLSALPGAAASGREDERNLLDEAALFLARAVPHLDDDFWKGEARKLAAELRSAPRPGGQAAGDCRVPPPGWWCSREAGHEGPCAARPEPLTEVERKRLAFLEALVTGAGRMDNYVALPAEVREWEALRARAAERGETAASHD